MTDLRTAAQQALGILCSEFTTVDGEFCRWCDGRLNAKHNCKLEQTITALRAALAEPPANQCGETCEKAKLCAACARELEQPVQEPVAWMFTDREGTEFFEQREDWDGRWTPLYAAPPQRQPQTIDEAMQQPRAMAQAYEAGYKAGEANEREACARACEHQPHWVACAAAIRARSNT